MNLKVLFITMHPLDANTGGSIASRNFFTMLNSVVFGRMRAVIPLESELFAKQCGVEELVLVPERKKWEKLLYFFRGICRDRFSPYVDEHIERLMKGVTHVVLDGSMLGRFSRSIKKSYPEARVLMLHHNFERKFYEDSLLPWWQKLFIHKVIDYNQGAGWAGSDVNLVFTEKDKQDLMSAYGRCEAGRCDVFGYYEDCSELIVNQKEYNDSGPLKMIITGNMSLRKGYEGVIWFLDNVFSSLSTSKYKLTIAGRSPHADLVVASKRFSNVDLIPNPPSMVALLRESDVFVNPSSIGSGIKVRNFDGLRMGLPVVCKKGNEYGFETLPRSVFAVFDTPDEFRENLLQVTMDRNYVFEEYKKIFSADVGVCKLDELLS